MGFTVTLKVVSVPVQEPPALVKVGITVIVAVTGLDVVFVAVNEAILPVPAEGRPMVELSFVHEYSVPGTPPVIVTGKVPPWWHTTWLVTGLTVGKGFTVMLNEMDVPGQFPRADMKTGLTVMFAVTGAVVVLETWKGAISPVPVAARPIRVLLLIQV